VGAALLSGSKKILFTTGLLFALAGQANAEHADGHETDPWEGMNRKVFAFNETVDRYFLKPVAKGYQWVTPEPVDKGITNVFNNLFEVINVINDLLQFKLGNAANDSGRFLINSTIGLAGVFDVATRMGLERNEEDYGQTFAEWGMNSGPYLVLPLLGPSTPRDAIGLVPEFLTHPISYVDHVPTRNTLRGIEAIDTRADLLEAEKLIEGDRYVFIRDAYLQRREFLINDGDVTDSFGEDDFGEEGF
jgi:phospholipid-binding lipoprotein MlaA